MTTILAFAVAIGVLVVFHELGHYWVARLCDVKVLRFSVGFGRALYTWRSRNGETEWALSMIPLGGYVKMLDEREGEVAPHELGRAFNRKPVLQRIAIVAAGPVFNLLLAVILYVVLFMHGVPGTKPVVGEVPPDTPAARAHLQAQETLVSVNGEAVPSWEEVHWMLMNLALSRGQIDIVGRTAEGDERRHVLDMSQIAPSDLDGAFMTKLGLQPYLPQLAPVVGEVLAGSVAERAGLRPGDRLLRADGRDISHWGQWVTAVRSHPSARMHLDIQRDGRELVLDITPEAVSEAGKTIGRVGAGPRIEESDRKAFEATLTEVSYPPLAALGQALRKTRDISVLSLRMMGKMVMGQVSLKNLSGPVTIADYAGQSARLGLGAYLSFLALISVSLGVLNLLPIPVLDGGYLLYYMAELLKGSPVSERTWELGQKVGLVLLAALMTLALYNDISSRISG